MLGTTNIKYICYGLLFMLTMHGKSLTLCFCNKKIFVKYRENKNVRVTVVIVVVLLSALDTLMSVQGRNMLFVDNSLAYSEDGVQWNVTFIIHNLHMNGAACRFGRPKMFQAIVQEASGT